MHFQIMSTSAFHHCRLINLAQVVTFASWSLTSVQAQTPMLNELMASNDLAVFDDFFEADDWVEIYNPGPLVQLAVTIFQMIRQLDQIHVP